MEEMLTRCGYRCDLCPAYRENIKNDDDKRRVSEGWKRIFGFDIAPDDVECAGCNNEGRHIDPNCPVRSCTMVKGYDNCARCEGYICADLKTRVNFIEEYLSKTDSICTEDYEKYVKAYESKPRLCELRGKLR
ncbi:MAG: DUF3795 domain-containing protein [Clostridiaceae bacterium]